MLAMNPTIDDRAQQASEDTGYGRALIETDLVPGPPSERASPFSSISTRTPPSTPATLRTAPSRPGPPRRHTEKPILHRAPSIQFSPAVTHKTPFDYPGVGSSSDPYTEQSYLVQSLQSQNERAKRLMQRMSMAEERLLLGCHATGEARKIRKEMRLIKKKIDDSAQQERLTVQRLGELYVEIQTRERWVQLQQLHLQRFEAAMVHQQQQQQTYYPPVFGSSASHSLAAGGTTISTQLPDIVPSTADMTPPPPPPPPTAASCFFSSVSPVSPGSLCLSPLSPSFVPGQPLDEDSFWSVERQNRCVEQAGGGATYPAHDENFVIERGRGYTPASLASNRTSSMHRPASDYTARARPASVPAIRMAWADDVDVGEE